VLQFLDLGEFTMAGSINKVILIGNLGRDPEVRFSQEGKKIVNFSIATSESWKDKTSGERREKTEWHRIVIFSDGLAGIAERFLKKGSKVYLEGALQTRKWTGNDGVEKYTTEVILQGFNGTLTMLDGRGEGGGDYNSNSPSYEGEPDNIISHSDNASGDNAPGVDLDDEIPF
jgi:single-strand DNA-binding protein